MPIARIDIRSILHPTNLRSFRKSDVQTYHISHSHQIIYYIFNNYIIIENNSHYLSIIMQIPFRCQYLRTDFIKYRSFYEQIVLCFSILLSLSYKKVIYSLSI